MAEVTADDLELLNDSPVSSTPQTMTADEMDILAPVAIEENDAPKGFWERRGGDVMISGAQAARSVGSAMVFFGDKMLRDTPSPYGDIRHTPNVIERVWKSIGPHLHPETAKTVGKLFVQTGTGFQDILDKFISAQKEGREDEGRYDIPTMVTQGGVSILASLGTAMVLGPTAVGVTVGGGSFFETYDQAMRKGKNFQEATGLAAVMGLAQGGLEFTGLHAFLSVTGPAVKRFIKSGLIESIQEGSQTGSQEVIERTSGISETTKQGFESVQEGVADTLVAAALGFALGAPASIGPAMQNRRQAKNLLVEQGFTEEQSIKIVDRALEQGVSGALEIVNHEMQLISKGVYRDADGNPIEYTSEGSRILTQAEVVAKFTKVPDAVLNPLIETALEVIDKAAPMKETIGVTAAEKAFTELAVSKESPLSPNVVKTIVDKFDKIEKNMKRAEPKTKARIKVIQQEIEKFVKTSGLELKDKAKFLSTIKNVQTFQQLERAMPELRERIAALKETQDQREAIATFEKLTEEKRLKKTEAGYQQAIRNLIKDLTTTKMSVKSAMSLDSLAKHLEENPDNVVPQYKINELRRLELKSLRDMSSQDINLINATIGHLLKLGENKATLFYKGELVDADSIQTDVVRRLETVPTIKELDGRDIDPLKFAGGHNIFDALKNLVTLDRRQTDIIAQELDTTDDGPFKNIMWSGFRDSRAHTLRLEQAVEDYFVEALKGTDTVKWSEYLSQKKKGIEADKFSFIGKKGNVNISVTKAQQIYFYLAMQNENSARHIMTGGISFDRDSLRGVAYQVSEETATKILERVANDPDMMKVANAVSGFLNGFQKDLLNNASFRLNGFSVAVEDNYVHIRVNPTTRTDMAKIASRQSISHALLEGLGLLKPRVKSKVPIYLDDIFASVQESSYYAIRYATYSEPLRTAKRLTNNDVIKTMLETQGRGRYLKSLDEHIQRVEGQIITGNDVDKIFRLLNNNVQAAILRLNPRIALMQYTAYFSSLAETDLKYWTPSFRPIVSEAELAEIKQWSPTIYDRTRGHTIKEIGELVDASAVRKMFTGKSAYDDLMLAGIRKADRAVLASIWRAVKAEVSDLQPELNGEAYFRRVAERAEEVVRKTQAPYDVNDRSAFLGRKDWASRTFSVFGSEIDALANIVERAQLEWKQSNKSWAELGKYAKRMGAVYLLNGLISSFIRLPFNILKESPDKGRDDEEEKDAEIIVKRLLVDILSGPIGLVFGLREIGTRAVAGLMGVSVNWDVTQPVFSTLSDAASATNKIFTAINEAVMGEEYSDNPKEKKKDWVNKIGEGIIDFGVAAAAFKRIPAGNVRQFSAPFFTEEEEK